MDIKARLEQYTDSVELIDELKKEIEQLEQDAVSITVKGSASDFPFTEKTIHLTGAEAGGTRLHIRRELLKRQVEKLEDERLELETIVMGFPPQIQRIIRFRYFEHMTWLQVDHRMHYWTGSTARMALNQFLKKWERQQGQQGTGASETS